MDYIVMYQKDDGRDRHIAAVDLQERAIVIYGTGYVRSEETVLFCCCQDSQLCSSFLGSTRHKSAQCNFKCSKS